MQEKPTAVPARAKQAGDAQAIQRRARWPDTIPHDRLMEQVQKHVADSRALRLIRAFLEAKIMEQSAQWTPMAGERGWVRGRLRSLRRKRQKRKGIARGKDHQRWPKPYFAEQGLYTLTDSFVRECQSVQAAR
jgi:hypothetical protein